MKDIEELHIGAFVGFLSFAAKTLTHEFERETNIKCIRKLSPFERMVDEATGYDRVLAEKFIDWAAEKYGKEFLPTDYKEQIMRKAQS